MSNPRKSVVVVLTVLAVFSIFASTAQAEQRVLLLDPAASKVSFTLDATGHDVEGVLAMKSGRIAFDPATGEASGEIAVDLKSGKTGNDGRDKTMHKEVLEDDKYPLAVFRAERVRGDVPAAGTAQITLDGVMSFHGSDHKMSLPAKVEVHGGKVKAETSFPVPFVEWGLHDPSIMILRVAKVVSVKVKAEGSLEAAGVGTR